MGDEGDDEAARKAAVAKTKRSTALRNFTRANNMLTKLMANEKTAQDMLEKQFDKFLEAWNTLEAAHGDYLEIAEVEDDEYLNDPEAAMQAGYVEYNDRSIQLREKEKESKDTMAATERTAEEAKRAAAEEGRKKDVAERVKTEKAKFLGEAESFKDLARILENKVGTDIGAADKRRELAALEKEFGRLRMKKTEVVGLDPAGDHTEVKNAFSKDVGKVFEDVQRMILEEVKDTPTGPIVHSGGAAAAAPHSTTKTERVKLPHFKGNEKESPYLKFPVWKQQWDGLIVDYDEVHRAGLLFDHIDDAAKNKLVGVESNYDEAMRRLVGYFGNPVKVVQSCMKEVMTQSFIQLGDYKSLVDYSHVLENNYNRLSSLGLAHEISNTSTMSMIIRKFPRMTGEKWNEFLGGQSNDVQAKPFPKFVEWLVAQRGIWERMAAADGGRKPGASGRADGMAHYGEYFEGDVHYGDSYERSEERRSCYGCGEEGHIRRDCPAGRGGEKRKSDFRRPPEHKHFWCALHKGDNTKRCWSNSCQELKMTDNATRVELLKENRDCVYCCGDHPSERCEWKLRKCGGGNVNRGCGEDHNVHEMHCPDARCYSIQISPAESKVEKEEGKEMEEKPGEDLEADCLHAGGNETLLQVMRVKGQKGGTKTSVFFDPGSTSGFVREKYAEQQGFKGRKMRLGVTTLSGEKKEYDGKLYTCYIRDTDGQLHEFQAYGLEVITGPLSRIDMHRVEKLFPNMSKSQLMDLNRPNQVDILIGMDHASWHPQRVEKAVDVEGDLWIYRGMFGRCLGGRHPLVREASRRSDSLFVNVEKVGMEVSMQEVGRDCEDDGAEVVSGKGESDLGDKVREEDSDGDVDDDDKSGQIGDEDEEGFERMGEAQEDQLGAGFGGGPAGGGRRGGGRLGGVLGALVLVVVAVLLLAAGVTEDPSSATGALVLVVVVLLVVAGEVVVREVSEENGDKT